MAAVGRWAAGHAQHSVLQRAWIHQEVREEHPAAQVQHGRAGGVEGEFGGGEPVDLAGSRTSLGADAALEHDPSDPVLLDGASGDRAHGGVCGDRILGVGRW